MLDAGKCFFVAWVHCEAGHGIGSRCKTITRSMAVSIEMQRYTGLVCRSSRNTGETDTAMLRQLFTKWTPNLHAMEL